MKHYKFSCHLLVVLLYKLICSSKYRGTGHQTCVLYIEVSLFEDNDQSPAFDVTSSLHLESLADLQ